MSSEALSTSGETRRETTETYSTAGLAAALTTGITVSEGLMGQASDGETVTPFSRPGAPVWWYAQPSKRGIDRSFSGHIDRIHGVEAEQTRIRLAATITDLLHWACESTRGESEEDEQAP